MAAIGGEGVNLEVIAKDIRVAWSQLLPPNVWTSTALIDDHLGEITERDREGLKSCSSRRCLEFSTSRALIYGLFREHELPLPVGLPSGEEGAPQWPHEVVGSITHCRGICSVAVAETPGCFMLGLDLEQLGRMKAAVWPRIASAEEIDLMQQWASTHQHTIDTAMTVLFSLKESFFKAQFPRTRRYLGFLDVHLTPLDEADFFMDSPVPLSGIALRAAITQSHVLSAAFAVRSLRS